MQIPTHPNDPILAVLVVGQPGPGKSGLLEWLAEIPGLRLNTADELAGAALGSATAAEYDVIILDFHGIPLTLGPVVRRLKSAAATTTVFVLTHDASPVMRRYCAEAGVDAVFDKTSDFDLVRYALGLKRRVLGRAAFAGDQLVRLEA